MFIKDIQSNNTVKEKKKKMKKKIRKSYVKRYDIGKKILPHH